MGLQQAPREAEHRIRGTAVEHFVLPDLLLTFTYSCSLQTARVRLGAGARHVSHTVYRLRSPRPRLDMAVQFHGRAASQYASLAPVRRGHLSARLRMSAHTK